MSQSPSISITYTLHPPAETKAPEGHSSNKTIQVSVSASATQKHTEYYSKLHEAIEDARNQIGEDLTLWRDAVGKTELNKETKTLNEDEEDESEEEQ